MASVLDGAAMSSRHHVLLAAALAAGCALVACRGSGDIGPIAGATTAPAAGAAVTSAASTTDAPTTAPTSTVPDDMLDWAVYETLSPGVVKLRLVDTSGRNLTLDESAGPMVQAAGTANPRIFFALVSFPHDDSGSPLTDGPVPLLATGMPRDGTEPLNCLLDRTDVIQVCVGFALLDQRRNPTYFDTANQPGDVSKVLDVGFANPDVFGAVDTDHVVYSGGSIGGITGTWFIHPKARDERITAMLLSSSFAPYWVPAFRDPANWEAGPSILFVNGTEDTILPYALVRDSMGAIGGAANVTLLSVIGGGHDATTDSCPPANQFVGAWLDWQLYGGPEPARDAITSSTCAAFGLVTGGTGGLGSAAPYIP
jgi:hypothetical protein